MPIGDACDRGHCVSRDIEITLSRVRDQLNLEGLRLVRTWIRLNDEGAQQILHAHALHSIIAYFYYRAAFLSRYATYEKRHSALHGKYFLRVSLHSPLL